MNILRTFALLTAAVAVPASYGATIYTDFDANHDTYTGTGQQVKNSNGYSSPAYEFQAGLTAQLTEIDISLVMAAAGFGTSNATLELFSAVSGSPFDTVGAEIGSPYAVTAAAGGTTNPVDVVTVTGGPTLTAGTSYFLAVVPGTGNFLTWNQQTSPSLVSLLAKDITGTGMYVSAGNNGPGGFALIGTAATPEPATMALAGFALLSIGFFRKQRKA